VGTGASFFFGEGSPRRERCRECSYTARGAAELHLPREWWPGWAENRQGALLVVVVSRGLSGRERCRPLAPADPCKLPPRSPVGAGAKPPLSAAAGANPARQLPVSPARYPTPASAAAAPCSLPACAAPTAPGPGERSSPLEPGGTGQNHLSRSHLPQRSGSPPTAPSSPPSWASTPRPLASDMVPQRR
jgi:hypothetical protein